ncbi:MAG: 50S ribosomal protein L19 [Myxococcales bacterium]|nr:50S ribosomal protein L19 [Myxococcales bacterium]MDD9967811.1 50S ribosomal protein L19 [Myxococcales bacterium]
MGRFVPQIEALAEAASRKLPHFRVGDTVAVHYRIREGEKERIQVFQGTVIRKSRGGIGRTFAVRKRSGGVGVERIFPYNSPRIEALKLVSRNRVRRSKLYYLRELQGKAARLREIRGGYREDGTQDKGQTGGK